MLVAAICDSHFDETSRFEECIEIHDWIADDLERRGVDLILHGGDVYERRSTPAERRAVFAWVRACADVAPVVIVRGNHDVIGDLTLLEYIEGRHPVRVVEAARVIWAAGVAVACLAWPRKAYLALSGPDTDAATEVGNVLRHMGGKLAEHDGPSILLTHAMVNGARTSTGQPLVGCDLEITFADLQLAGADVTILGHVHKGQELGGSDSTFYVGSPRRTAFGELEAKRYALIDFATPESHMVPPSIEYIETPARRMVHLEARWSVDDGDGLWSIDHPGGGVEGAEVRLRYSSPADGRAGAAAHAKIERARLIGEHGAHSVKIEEVVIPHTRARAPQIVDAQTLDAKLETLWVSRDDVPDAERMDRLFQHVHTIEEELRNAD